MLQLKPEQNLYLVHQLSDPLDTDTNYVRAIIKNSSTGVTLATKDLTDAGSNSQRFTGYWRTNPDVSGNGYFIDVIYTVYTDSGYSSANENYQRMTERYFVREIWGPEFGHGGGVEVNYKKIGRMIQEAVERSPKPEIKETDLTPILEAIKAIVIPEPLKQEKMDDTSILAAIKGVFEAVRALPPPEKLDLPVILQHFSDARREIDKDKLDRTMETTEGMIQKVRDFFEEITNLSKLYKNKVVPPPEKTPRKRTLLP